MTDGVCMSDVGRRMAEDFDHQTVGDCVLLGKWSPEQNLKVCAFSGDPSNHRKKGGGRKTRRMLCSIGRRRRWWWCGRESSSGSSSFEGPMLTRMFAEETF